MMLRSMMFGIVLAVTMVAAAACGGSHSGGIVDNGARPKPTPDPYSAGLVSGVRVLGQFKIDLPAGGFTLTSYPDGVDMVDYGVKIARADEEVFLERAAELCPEASEIATNNYGFTTLVCSPTESILQSGSTLLKLRYKAFHGTPALISHSIRMAE